MVQKNEIIDNGDCGDVIKAEESEMIRDKIDKIINREKKKYVVRAYGIKDKNATNTEYTHSIIAKVVLWV